MPGRSSRDPQGGFVLVSVLLGLGLLVAIALAISYASRLDVRARGQFTRAAEARYLADGLVRLAMSRIGDREFPAHWRESAADGITVACRVGTAGALLSLIDTAGLVDLNAAPVALLSRLLVGLGARPDAANELSAAIADFRDADDTAQSGGSELDQYRAARLAHGPKNALFDTAAEIDQVVGMWPALYASLRPLVTVHSRLGGFDPAIAPVALLKVFASSGMASTGDAAELRQSMVRDISALPPEFRARATGRSFVVRALVSLPDGTEFAREAVAEVNVRLRTGVALRDWTQMTSGSRFRETMEALGLARAPFRDCREWLAIE